VAGEPSLNVLSINAGADPAGISASIARAFRRIAPEWRVVSITNKQNYIDYPQDVEWSSSAVRRAWFDADVVHLHHGFVTADLLVKGALVHKPYLVHHHGTQFRDDPIRHLRELRDHHAIGVVSTLDLYLLAPSDVEWLPAPFDTEALSGMRETHDPERIRIAHAPTNRAVKSTDEFLKAIARLQHEGYPVDVELIEGATWSECLRRKATADIYFDQVILGYGNNAVEAWGMGIPVIAGAADVTLDEMERRFGSLPFYHATQETIYQSLRDLVESPDLRAKYSQRGLEHVRRFHDDRVVVEQLKALYLRAIEEHQKRTAA
jgi:glycosyltransferase involved in cell wall biosynthesis